MLEVSIGIVQLVLPAFDLLLVGLQSILVLLLRRGLGVARAFLHVQQNFKHIAAASIHAKRAAAPYVRPADGL